MGDPTPAPASFDPQAFVDDLLAIGAEVFLVPALSAETAGRPYYTVTPNPDPEFGRAMTSWLEKWGGLMEACPDYADRVAAHLVDRVEQQDDPRSGTATDDPQLEG